MESLLSRSRMHWDHERRDWSAGLRPGAVVTPRGQLAPCRRPALWFMESLHSLWRMHWDHEPTPNPSQEGNRKDADGCLLPSWEGSGVGRFMETGCAAAIEGGAKMEIAPPFR